MILEIDDTKTTADLQDRFSMSFPSLKLEFCRKKHKWEEICSDSDIIHDNVSIGDIRKNHDPGIIEMKSWHKIGNIEKEFFSKFGLSVQITYKSGNRWIQTGKSDNITIDKLVKKTSAEQNRVLL
jgi:hypothetical protein